jgi:hypothetical protein
LEEEMSVAALWAIAAASGVAGGLIIATGDGWRPAILAGTLFLIAATLGGLGAHLTVSTPQNTVGPSASGQE